MAVRLAHLLTVLPVFFIAILARGIHQSDSSCRCFPGDQCWPTASEWAAFNSSLDGRLIATVPIAAACHDDKFKAFNADECAALQNVWFFPETHIPSASSIQAPFFTNNSCNPFLPESAPCTLGNYVSYSVNATCESDYQKTIAFIRKHNIRLVIKNTGHDYNGKSTGAGAVAIWTEHLKSMEVIKKYKSKAYTGTAVKMGAGVQVLEIYQFADQHNVVVVGGHCPTVGVAGGYTQGGGHGPLASTYGLAADQVLEWEVVTGTGQAITATPSQNSDLFWALCGGGGSTYGAVVSLTVKAHPAESVSSANMTFAKTAQNENQFWDVVNTFQASLLAFVDAGVNVVWSLSPAGFAVVPATAPALSKAKLDKLFEPTHDKLNQHKIQFEYVSKQYPTFLRSYEDMHVPVNVSQLQLGGRLIPRSLVEKNNAALTAALRSLIDGGTIFSGLAINVARGVSSPDAVAANPYWRETIFNAVIGTPFSYTDQQSNLDFQKQMTDELLPKFERLTPNGAAYLNEGDFRQPDWQRVFYGRNYDKLNKIKAKYDPEDRFYALTAVGSDRWVQRTDGRLCKA